MSLGIRCSIAASVIFGLIYYYAQALDFLDTQQGFGWRILLSLPFITLMLLMIGDLSLIGKIVKQVIKRPLLIFGVLATAALSGIQVWLFTWGAFAGRGLAVSLGYFLLPIVMVIIGRFFYKDHLTAYQKGATAFAVIGVSYAFIAVGYLPWEALVVALGYPAYFMLRKELGTDHLGGFWWDMALCLPVAAYFIATSIPTLSPVQWWWIIGFGALSALGLCFYILASRFLTFSMFGLMSYFEPILLSLVAVSMGEVISSSEWPTYVCIWIAVGLLVWDGIKRKE
jgi:chloramphenicol-sensitive protein RarD